MPQSPMASERVREGDRSANHRRRSVSSTAANQAPETKTRGATQHVVSNGALARRLRWLTRRPARSRTAHSKTMDAAASATAPTLIFRTRTASGHVRNFAARRRVVSACPFRSAVGTALAAERPRGRSKGPAAPGDVSAARRPPPPATVLPSFPLTLTEFHLLSLTARRFCGESRLTEFPSP